MKTRRFGGLVLMLLATCNSFSQNEDFELATPGVVTASNQVQGWTILRGVNTSTAGLCNPSNCCALTPSVSQVITVTGGTVDPYIGPTYPIYSVFGSAPGSTAALAANPQLGFAPSGNTFLRINSSDMSSNRIESAERTITVTPSTCIFEVAFASVMAVGHGCCDAAGFRINLNGALCQNNPYCLSGGIPYLNNGFGQVYNKWYVRTLNLSAYMNQIVNVSILAGHCKAGGHFGYLYVDSRIGPAMMTLNGNATQITAGTVNSLVTCALPATVGAPAGHSSFQWAGPAGFSSTLAAITATAAGIYTLLADQTSTCSATIYTVSLIADVVQIAGSTASICPGASVSIAVAGAQTVTWLPGGSTATSIVVSPSVTSTYSASGLSAQGCTYAVTYTQNVTSAPCITVTTSNPLINSGSSATLSVHGLSTHTWETGSTSQSIVVWPPVTQTYTVHGYTSDGAYGMAGITQSVQNIVAINSYSAYPVSLAPNPSTGEVLLQLTSDNVHFSLYGACGQVIRTEVLRQGENRLALSEIPPGIYYFRLVNEQQLVSSGKLILTR